MRHVVYKKDSGQLIGMYDKAGSAKAQVTRHNKKLTWALLTNSLRPWQQEQEEEWAHCTWAEYEPIFFRWYGVGGHQRFPRGVL